ncbi:threonine synthase [Sandaracinobacter sp. RS1-74]|uniref:threonine synthase n=1 Tax=Sandaracinobacteroides sayramensis TaxID=2913411 RepID=UPI001EDC2F7A|nr:threonine synthase [Sandaracinobacteroides sayramensis]MCG2842756.1 threonine synthase [Sandaracinobacteroides sayramensis]
MHYQSTRGQAPDLDFRGATLAGLATDGGLYLPAEWPRLSPQTIETLATASYAETAFTVMRPFVEGALSDAELKTLIAQAYGDFGHAAVTPLVELDHRHWLLELFHGPTLAFKDVALQLLGGLFGHFLADGERITIVGATSGDTGSAAIEAVAGRPGITIFMLHPQGRVSEVQRRQMTTVNAPNVHNIAVDGSFDDCQALVKSLFNDQPFRAEMQLSAVNSINWARLLAQIVYYVHAASRLGAPHRQVSFSVPTGNFGDVFAGYCAARMGLPIGRLLVATNVNDILARALNAGDYSVGQVAPTATPSMDIQVSSNFERLLFDLHGRDGAALAATMASFEATGRMALSEAQRAEAGKLFLAERVDETGMMQALAWANSECGQLLDPHTGVGLAAARARADELPGPIVTLATAHPAKFPEAVERATGVHPSLPRRVQHLFDREERFERLPADAEALKAHIRKHA